MIIRALAIALLCTHSALAQDLVFDSHVHLHDGEASLQAYEADISASKIKLVGFGGMWFGGPNMALQGNPALSQSASAAAGFK